MRHIQIKTIAVGAARAEGRYPSHDGEYITVYRVDGDNDVIAENNAGTFSLDDQGDEDQDWNEIREEARSKSGWRPMTRCGSEAREEMIELGWAVADQFDGNHYFPEGAFPADLR